jgi:hypothetical protein
MSDLPPLAPIPHIPVEPAFDRIVEMVGGCRVDSLFPPGIDWDDADYYFSNAGVVAELKEIVVDLNEDANLPRRLGDVLHRHAGRKDVPIIFGSRKVQIDTLPDDCRHELMDLFKRKLEGCVKKAAKQIKETKTHMNMPDARGLLILVNEASTFLRPDIAFYLLHHILNGQNSSIDGVVYCSINMLIDAPEERNSARFWSNVMVQNRRDIPASFMSRLSNAFFHVIDAQTGVPSEKIFADPDLLGTLTFKKRKHADNPNYFVQVKRFYRSLKNLGFFYYCEAISEGTATMYLVESWQNGQLVQAVFDQKLIHATCDQYELIQDKNEIARLSIMLRKLRRGE